MFHCVYKNSLSPFWWLTTTAKDLSLPNNESTWGWSKCFMMTPSLRNFSMCGMSRALSPENWSVSWSVWALLTRLQVSSSAAKNAGKEDNPSVSFLRKHLQTLFPAVDIKIFARFYAVYLLGGPEENPVMAREVDSLLFWSNTMSNGDGRGKTGPEIVVKPYFFGRSCTGAKWPGGSSRNHDNFSREKFIFTREKGEF